MQEPPVRNNVRTYNAVPISKDLFYISQIEVHGVGEDQQQWILRRGDLMRKIKKNNSNKIPYKGVITGDDINKAISRFYGR